MFANYRVYRHILSPIFPPFARGLVICLFLFFSNSSSALAKLQTPEPIKITNGLSIDAIEQAIVGGVIGLDWYFDGGTADVNVIRSDKGEKRQYRVGLSAWHYKIFIDIEFDEGGVSFFYADSVNLEYTLKSNGIQYVHKNYNVWVADLVNRISKNIALGTVYCRAPL